MHNNITNCLEALGLIDQMEQKLYDYKVITLGTSTANKLEDLEDYSNKSLMQLQATLLEMAAAAELCQGVFYIYPINVDGKNIVR